LPLSKGSEIALEFFPIERGTIVAFEKGRNAMNGKDLVEFWYHSRGSRGVDNFDLGKPRISIYNDKKVFSSG
jgi:hypothetical protein